ncbi:MAG: phosphoribosylformylglycinamidine synthase subunit PurS [Candidatus Margulisbacteria bacterium]|nr:phosphoribosylformylglycinamidine synthase subunit PurS [Candidatus Margulisiibacteriota bacterium]
MFKAEVKITLKKTVSDPQGLTVKHALEALNFSGIEQVRMGKFITVELKAKDQDKAKDEVQNMCQKLLANPIIEDFSFELKEV